MRSQFWATWFSSSCQLSAHHSNKEVRQLLLANVWHIGGWTALYRPDRRGRECEGSFWHCKSDSRWCIFSLNTQFTSISTHLSPAQSRRSTKTCQVNLACSTSLPRIKVRTTLHRNMSGYLNILLGWLCKIKLSDPSEVCHSLRDSLQEMYGDWITVSRWTN